MKLKFKELYMDIAKRIAQMSYCERKKVGAVIVKDNNILSFGYNGTPSGFDNCCEEWVPNKILRNMVSITKTNVLHAEQNALMKLAATNKSSDSASLFVTLQPCATCALLIIQAKIKEVYFNEAYRDNTGLDILNKAGIKTEQL